MNSRTIERSLFAIALTLGLLAAARWYTGGAEVAVAPIVVPPARRSAQPPSDSALEEAEALTVTNDPFRLSNTPPEVRYDLVNEVALAGGFVPALVRPQFVLRAIVGGPPWHAVVDGIPGQSPGTVVRPGAQFDKITVRSVTRDSVVVRGPDTTWVLRFGRQP